MLSGWKTILFSLLITILGFLETFDITQIASMIPAEYQPLVISVIGVIVAVLRFVTKTPVGK
jgi:uncharacterized membrane protein